MGTAKGDGYTVTPRDLELVVHSINCSRLPFELDYDKLARRLGYKNAQSAKAAWNALKKKLDKVAEGAPVVPSLTIEPEPMRRVAVAEPSSKAEASAKKKGKPPIVDPPSEPSDDDSEDESEDPAPAPKLSKRRKHARIVGDNDGDVSMAEDHPRTSKSKSKANKSSSRKRKDCAPETKKRRRTTISTTSASASASNSESEDAEERLLRMQTPRQKLKRKFTHLAVRNQAGPVKMTGQGKSAAMVDQWGEASAAREKAFEAFRTRGVAGGGEDEGEDDEEVDPPPAYIKREAESGGEGMV